MFSFLNSPVFIVITYVIGAAFCLFIAYMEMPPKKNRKTGTKTPLGQRLSGLGRTGWGTLIPGVLLSIAAVAGTLDLVLN